jgi:hypothetical protein
MSTGVRSARRTLASLALACALAACGGGAGAGTAAKQAAGVTAATGAPAATGATARATHPAAAPSAARSPRPATPVAAAGSGSSVTSPRLPRTPASKSLDVALTALGPARGSGKATIQIFTRLGKVCWSFGSLTGVASPSGAAVGIGDVGGGAVEFPLGSGFARQGCTKPAIAAGGLDAIAVTPGDFFLEVTSRQGPADVPSLRGQLAPGVPIGSATLHVHPGPDAPD